MHGLFAVTIFLNPNGGTFYRAMDDSRLNRASAIQYDQADVPAYAYGAASWDDVVSCVRDVYAPFDVVVTDEDPGDVEHTECVVGGAGYDLGLPDVGGVASFNCAYIPNSVAFVFPDHAGNDPQRICETVAQETAHTFGLDHEYLCEDALTYLDGCGPKTFVDEDAPCGERAPRPCTCGGSTQNSYEMLMDLLGPQTMGAPPSVIIDSPGDGEVVAPGFRVTATATDDGAVDRVEIFVDGTAAGSLAAAPWRFDTAADLAEGAHAIEVRATDVDGLSASASISVVIDAAAPPEADREGDDGGGIVGDPDDDDFGGHSGLGCAAASDRPSSPAWLLAGLLVLARRRR